MNRLQQIIRLYCQGTEIKPFSGRTYSLREQFEEVEREALVKLKPLRYGVNKQVMVTVMKNGYVCLGEDIHYYSVPYNYIGKKSKGLIYFYCSKNLLPIYPDRFSPP
jgi:hypothetical protein